MKTISIYPLQDSGTLLTGYLHPYFEEMPHRKTRPCVVICPGGAYKYCSDREADPIAEAYFAKGFQVFVLYYSTTGKEMERPATGFTPLCELSASVVQYQGARGRIRSGSRQNRGLRLLCRRPSGSQPGSPLEQRKTPCPLSGGGTAEPSGCHDPFLSCHFRSKGGSSGVA